MQKLSLLSIFNLPFASEHDKSLFEITQEKVTFNIIKSDFN